MIQLGFETLGYHANNKMVQELTDLFQHIIQARDEHEKVPDRIKAVTQTVKKYKSKISSTIEEHTGLRISPFKMKKNLGGSIKCIPFSNIKDNGWIEYVITNTQAGNEHLERVFDDKDLEDMKQIVSSISKTGKIEYNIFKDQPLTCGITLDIEMLFLARENINIKMPEFTAQEITAMVVREIGVMFGIVEHISDTIYKVNAASTISMSYLKDSNVSVDKKIEFIRNNIKLVKGDKESAPVLDLAEQALVKIKYVTDEAEGKLFKQVSKYIVAPMLTFVFMLLGPIVILLSGVLNIAESTLTSMYSKIVRTGKISNKLSDQLWINRDITIHQQWSLNYVSKLGLGGALASAELKYRKIYDTFNYAALVTSVDKSAFAYNLSKSYVITAAIARGFGGSMMTSPSSNIIPKLKQLMRSNISLFKQEKIPSDLLMVYVEDYENIMKCLDSLSAADKAEAKAQRIINIIKKILNSPTALFTNNINATMKELNDLAENLNNNNLYYTATKLDLLSKKM